MVDESVRDYEKCSLQLPCREPRLQLLQLLQCPTRGQQRSPTPASSPGRILSPTDVYSGDLYSPQHYRLQLHLQQPITGRADQPQPIAGQGFVYKLKQGHAALYRVLGTGSTEICDLGWMITCKYSYGGHGPIISTLSPALFTPLTMQPARQSPVPDY